MRLSVGVAEAATLVQPRRARVIERRARPEDAHLLVDLLPGNPEIVGHTAFRGNAQLVEDLLRRAVHKLVGGTEPRGEVADDPPILPGARRRIDCLLMVDDAALDVGGGAFVLFHQGARQNHICMLCRFGKEEVAGGEELQLLERFANEGLIGQRH